MDNLLVQVAAMAATAGLTSAVVAAFFLFGRKAKEEEASEISLEEGLAALRQVIAASAAAEVEAAKAEAAAEAAVAKATAAREAAVAAAAKAADAEARITMMEEALRA